LVCACRIPLICFGQSERAFMTDESKSDDTSSISKNRYFSLDDSYRTTDRHRFSPILFLLVNTTFVLRRLSLLEIIKRPCFRGHTPAWFLDVYLLLVWTSTAVFVCLYDTKNELPFWIVWIYAFLVLQILQTNFYHELWRPVLLLENKRSVAIAYSKLRNLCIGFGNFSYTTCLFGLIYWKCKESFVCECGEQNFPFKTPWDAIYFSFTIAWSAGSESIPSVAVDDFVKGVVVAQIVATLFLLSIIIAISTSAIRTTQEKPITSAIKSDNQ